MSYRPDRTDVASFSEAKKILLFLKKKKQKDFYFRKGAGLLLDVVRSFLPAGLTRLAFALHIAGGTVGLLAGFAAVIPRKGGWLHRQAGTIFVISMLIMAAFAVYLGVALPGQLINVLIGTFTLYLVTTAWRTLRPRQRHARIADGLALSVILCLAAPFALLIVQLALGQTPFLNSSVPLEGPVLIFLYVFTFILAAAVYGDGRVLLKQGLAGRAHIERHVWRMCLGLSFAAGSALTNGLPRLLPDSVHIPLFLLFVPQLSALALLIFWMLRVHFTTQVPARAVS
jgi:hypothetical protein